MNRYNIYYRKYSIMANDYFLFVRVVYTDDIYHEIGKMICTSIEKIDSIRYTEPRASLEDCEKYWIDSGYKKLCQNVWVAYEEIVKEGSSGNISD